MRRGGENVEAERWLAVIEGRYDHISLRNRQAMCVCV